MAKPINCSICNEPALSVERGPYNDHYITCSNKQCILQRVYPMISRHWNKLHQLIKARIEESVADVEIDLAEMEDEVNELRDLFDLQHKRVHEAEEYWRKKTKASKLIKPDLGKLIEFLMGKIFELEQMKTPLKKMNLGLNKEEE
jgi:hypothetical protein